MELADSHCHLTWSEYDADRDAVIARARAAGVTAMLTIGAGQGLEGNAKAIALAERHPDIFAAVGLHPQDANCFGPDTVAELERLARHPKVAAIGEIGLDYHYAGADRAQQHAVFATLLDLAIRCGLPVILHQRDAEEDLLRILDEWQRGDRSHAMQHWRASDGTCPHIRGVHHCFGGERAFAEAMIQRGFLLGIGGVVTFKNAQSLRDIVKAIPLDHLVLETDAPYLAPVPYRGKRNEPAYLVHAARMVAECKGCTMEEVGAVTTATALRALRVKNHPQN